MGSTSLLPEALIIAWSLSDYGSSRSKHPNLSFFLPQPISNFPEEEGMRTVTSTPSSARMRAAYETASSELDIVCLYGRFLS